MPVDLLPREKTRDTARINIQFDDNLARRLQTDSNLRVLVFCALETYDSSWKPADIAFPQHSELRVNSTEIKANLKGLKNKPGSTRPADITDAIRKKPNFPNSIELVYALTAKVRLVPIHASDQFSPFPLVDVFTLTCFLLWCLQVVSQQKYVLTINLVNKLPFDLLVSQLKSGKFLSRERVIAESKIRTH